MDEQWEIFDYRCQIPASPCPSISSLTPFFGAVVIEERGVVSVTVVILPFITFLKSRTQFPWPFYYFSLLVLISFDPIFAAAAIAPTAVECLGLAC